MALLHLPWPAQLSGMFLPKPSVSPSFRGGLALLSDDSSGLFLHFPYFSLIQAFSLIKPCMFNLILASDLDYKNLIPGDFFFLSLVDP